jgi:signal transduction histidine kinase
LRAPEAERFGEAVATVPVEHGAGAAAEIPFLEGLVQGIRCGILAIDIEGRIRLVNRVAREILDLPSVRTGVLAADELREHPQLLGVLGEAFGMSCLPNRAELELGRHGGRTIGFTMSMVPGSDGSPIGVAVFFKDLTQIEHKEEQERLRDRLAALGQMAAALAHEIRNPLASIDVTCSLLKRRLVDDGDRDLLGTIAAEVRRLNRTVSSSLEYVRPVALQLERASLEPVLEEAILAATNRNRSGGTAVDRSYCKGLPPFLMDRGMLRQVFENLVLNALQALGGKGEVHVSTEVIDASSEASVPYRPSDAGAQASGPRSDQFVVVRIADTGPGICAADLDRIFHPFFTTKEQGSGIGLAVVRKIVSGHRGLIDVRSSPGNGTEFTVRLPVTLSVPEV